MMIISRVILKNWRNFQLVDVELGRRVFIVGPNACGKSNFLDVFRFMRDIAKSGGGLQSAVSQRGGLGKIRCLFARKPSDVEIDIHLTESSTIWQYAIGITQEQRGKHLLRLKYERVLKDGELLINRPDEDDQKDKERLTQTFLEQIIANKEFRDVADFFVSVSYLHLVPQLIRHPEALLRGLPDDPFGQNFIKQVAETSEKTRQKHLNKIEAALCAATPHQLKNLKLVKDDIGAPHLEATYQHWRPHGAKQREDQFSDGTLRLMGLLWLLLEGKSLLLLEEPELSLNPAIVRKIPAMMYRIQKKRQVMISTHSSDLLSDKGIGGEDVLIMIPNNEGTTVSVASSKENIKLLLESGLSVADVIMPETYPPDIDQLDFFSR